MMKKPFHINCRLFFFFVERYLQTNGKPYHENRSFIPYYIITRELHTYERSTNLNARTLIN